MQWVVTLSRHVVREEERLRGGLRGQCDNVDDYRIIYTMLCTTHIGEGKGGGGFGHWNMLSSTRVVPNLALAPATRTSLFVSLSIIISFFGGVGF